MAAKSANPQIEGTELARTPTHRRTTRSDLTNEMVASFVRSWRRHGDKALEKLYRTQVGVYVKMAVLLVPKEHKVEHSNVISGMTDDEIRAAITEIQDSIDRKAGKLVDAVPLAIPQPGEPGHRDGIWAHAATAVTPGRKRTKRG